MALTTQTTDPEVVTIAPVRPSARRLAGNWRTTPGRLRAARALLLALCLAAGAVGVYSARARVNATTEIDRRSGPLSAATIDVYRSLAAADAAVAAEFLSRGAGADRTEARQDYDEAMRDAAVSLADAGRLVGEEGVTAEAIAALGAWLPVYTELLGRARALDVPGGLAPLGEASALMQTSILRQAETLQRSEARRLDAEYRRAGALPTTALAACLLTLVALAAVQLALFRRSRRILNVGLVASSALVVGALAWSAMALSVSRDHLDSSRRHSKSVTDALGVAQIAALQARAYEMLGLATDTSAYEDDYLAKTQVLSRDGGAGGALGAALQLVPDNESWELVKRAVRETSSWEAAHRQVITLGKEGHRAQAVGSAIDREAHPSGSAAAFDRLGGTLAGAVEAEDDAFARDIRRADGALVGLVFGTGALALAAAAAAAWGIGRRLEEYR